MKKDPVLEVTNLTKVFSSGRLFARSKTYINAVNQISFVLNKGEILGLLGPNGAGKTTIIQMLIGTLKPTQGSIHYFGKEFETNRSDILQYVGFASNALQLPATLTIVQNLTIHARLYGISAKDRTVKITNLLKAFGIWNIRDARAGCLSLGQITRVMLVKAFLANPRIVFLDEATSALDPEIARDVRKFLLEHRQTYDTAIFLASHNMAEVAQICDRVLVMKEGSIIANNSPDVLTKQISTVKLRFTYDSNDVDLEQFLQKNNIVYALKDNNVLIEVSEDDIASLLRLFAQEEINYTNIAIERPTLEDYFLNITTTKNNN